MQYVKYLLSAKDERAAAVVDKIRMQSFNATTPDGLVQIALGAPFSILIVPARGDEKLPGGREVQEQAWKEIKALTKLAWGYMDERRNAVICIVCPVDYVGEERITVRGKEYEGYTLERKPAVFRLTHIIPEAIDVFNLKRAQIASNKKEEAAPVKEAPRTALVKAEPVKAEPDEEEQDWSSFSILDDDDYDIDGDGEDDDEPGEMPDAEPAEDFTDQPAPAESLTDDFASGILSNVLMDGLTDDVALSGEEKDESPALDTAYDADALKVEEHEDTADDETVPEADAEQDESVMEDESEEEDDALSDETELPEEKTIKLPESKRTAREKEEKEKEKDSDKTKYIILGLISAAAIFLLIGGVAKMKGAKDEAETPVFEEVVELNGVPEEMQDTAQDEEVSLFEQIINENENETPVFDAERIDEEPAAEMTEDVYEGNIEAAEDVEPEIEAEAEEIEAVEDEMPVEDETATEDVMAEDETIEETPAEDEEAMTEEAEVDAGAEKDEAVEDDAEAESEELADEDVEETKDAEAVEPVEETEPEGTEEPVEEHVTRPYAVVTSVAIAIRDAPNMDSGTIGYMNNGESLPVLDSTSYRDWIEVEFKGRVAYMNRYYVSIQEW